jgi:hypothetical protein
MVMDIYNPSYLGGRNQETQFKASLGKRLTRPHSTSKPAMVWWYMPVIQAVQKA